MANVYRENTPKKGVIQIPGSTKLCKTSLYTFKTADSLKHELLISGIFYFMIETMRNYIMVHITEGLLYTSWSGV